MVSALIRVFDEQRDLLLAELMDLGFLGCVEEEQGLRVFFEDQNKAQAVTEAYPVVEIREEPETINTSSNHEAVEPVFAGQFFIVPPWSIESTPEDRLRLDASAGPAFGSGRHETTRLMLSALEGKVYRTSTIADIGCGSGILTQAALLLGASRVVACDIDSLSFPLTFVKQNPGPLVFMGSADALQADLADVVLANISAKVIDWIAGDLNRIAKPAGVLILSGFIRERPPIRFSPLEETSEGDWLCWICRPSAGNRKPPAIIHSRQWY